jgi:S-adenosylmethionine uptake transporter
LRGALLMTLSSGAFAFNYAFMKLLFADLPVFQAIALRASGATMLLLILATARGLPIFTVPKRDRFRMAIRILAEAAAAFGFLAALSRMEFNNAAAISQVTPLVVAVAAAIWLHERLTIARALAVLIGFAGVFIILLPGREGFNWWSLSVLGSVTAVTIRDMVTRRMSHDIPAIVMALQASAGLTVLAWCAASLGDFQPVGLLSVAKVFGSSSFLIVGYLSAIAAMRFGDVTFVAPFRYTNMVFAIGVAVVVFGEKMAINTMIGAAIVIGAGIFSLLADRRLARLAAKSLQ